MNRYDDFEHRRYERETRGGDYSRARRPSSHAAAGYATSSNLDISDHTREERPRRVRPRQTANFISLYPSVHNLPEIPSAAVVFSKVGRKRAPDHYNDSAPAENDVRRSTLESYHQEPQREQQSPNPVEEDESVSFERPLVEVAPGHWVELRGSEETWSALQRNFSRKVNCFCCETPMKVIADAAMVLCPECRMICPLDDVVGGRGLGLGVKLLKEEEEISSASFHSEKSTNTASYHSEKSSSTKGKKDAELKDDTDSGHSIHCKRNPTTNLGARNSPERRERSQSPRVVPRYR